MTSLPVHGLHSFYPTSVGSSYSVRDAFESYRRAQFLAVEVNTTSDHSDIEDDLDEEAGRRNDDDEDALSDGELTPRPLLDHDSRQPHLADDWDEFDSLTPSNGLYPSTGAPSYFPATQRPTSATRTPSRPVGRAQGGSRPTPILNAPPAIDERTRLLRKESQKGRKPLSHRVITRRPSAPASHPSWSGPNASYGTSDTLPADSDKAEAYDAYVPGKSTFGQTLFNAIAILVGIGMLSEPIAFVHAGWLTGTALIVFYGFITCYTAKILARIIQANPRLRSYSDICRLAFGPRSSVFISLFFCFELFAVSVVLVTLYADSLSTVLPLYSSNTYKVLGFFLLLPTLFLPLSLLSYASVLGILSTVLLVAVIFIDGFTKFEAPGSIWSPADTDLGVKNIGKLGISFGLFMAGFSGHAVMPSLARDMANPEDFDTMINWAFAVATLIYTLIGYAGYAMFGVAVSDEVSMDLLRTPGYNPLLNKLTLWMLVISPLTKFALATQPMNVTIENMLGLTAPSMTVERQLSRQGYQVSGTRRTHAVIKRTLAVVQRVVLTLMAVLVSMLVPDFSALMSFLGSFSAFSLAVIGPIFAKIMIDKHVTKLDSVLILISVIMAVWGTLSAIQAATGNE